MDFEQFQGALRIRAENLQLARPCGVTCRAMEYVEFVPLPELFQELGGDHWIVKFRCSFRKPPRDRVHFEWAALVELNREGRINFFDETWKKIPRWKMLRPPAAEDAEDIGAWTCKGKASAAKSTRRRDRKRKVHKRDRWWPGRARNAFEETRWE